MKPQFQHQVVTSFALWLDHIILSKGEAFQNIQSSFYHQNERKNGSRLCFFRITTQAMGNGFGDSWS